MSNTYPRVVYEKGSFKIVQNFDESCIPDNSEPLDDRMDWQFVLIYTPLNSVEAHNTSYLNLRMHAIAGDEAEQDIRLRETALDDEVEEAEVIGTSKAH